MIKKSTNDESPKQVPIASGPMTIALSSIRNTEAYLRWQGAQWVIALNLSAFVALLYQTLSQPKKEEFFVLAVACAFVAALDFEWYNVLRRDGKLLNFWNQKISEHEAANGIEGGVQVFTSLEYLDLAASRQRLQRVLERITVVLIFIWTVAAIALFTWAIAKLKGGV